MSIEKLNAITDSLDLLLQKESSNRSTIKETIQKTRSCVLEFFHNLFINSQIGIKEHVEVIRKFDHLVCKSLLDWSLLRLPYESNAALEHIASILLDLQEIASQEEFLCAHFGDAPKNTQEIVEWIDNLNLFKEEHPLRKRKLHKVYFSIVHKLCSAIVNFKDRSPEADSYLLNSKDIRDLLWHFRVENFEGSKEDFEFAHKTLMHLDFMYESFPSKHYQLLKKNLILISIKCLKNIPFDASFEQTMKTLFHAYHKEMTIDDILIDADEWKELSDYLIEETETGFAISKHWNFLLKNHCKDSNGIFVELLQRSPINVRIGYLASPEVLKHPNILIDYPHKNRSDFAALVLNFMKNDPKKLVEFCSLSKENLARRFTVFNENLYKLIIILKVSKREGNRELLNLCNHTFSFFFPIYLRMIPVDDCYQIDEKTGLQPSYLEWTPDKYFSNLPICDLETEDLLEILNILPVDFIKSVTIAFDIEEFSKYFPNATSDFLGSLLTKFSSVHLDNFSDNTQLNDLCLTNESEMEHFYIHSKYLAELSGYFKAQLFGNFKEGKQLETEKSELFTISVPSQDYSMLEVLLSQNLKKAAKIKLFQDWVELFEIASAYQIKSLALFEKLFKDFFKTNLEFEPKNCLCKILNHLYTTHQKSLFQIAQIADQICSDRIIDYPKIREDWNNFNHNTWFLSLARETVKSLLDQFKLANTPQGFSLLKNKPEIQWILSNKDYESAHTIQLIFQKAESFYSPNPLIRGFSYLKEKLEK